MDRADIVSSATRSGHIPYMAPGQGPAAGLGTRRARGLDKTPGSRYYEGAPGDRGG